MKLRRILVQNYRSIVDSGVIEIEDRVTVLIGKNEQGKTTFLKALASAGPRPTYSSSDLPNHLRPTLEDRSPGEIPILTLWLALEPSDKAPLSKIIPDLGSVEFFKITKFYDGHRLYQKVTAPGQEESLEIPPPDIEPYAGQFRRHATALKEKLVVHAGRLPAFAPHLPQAQMAIDQFSTANFREAGQLENLVNTLASALTSVPGQDQAIQEDVAAFIKEIQGVCAQTLQLMRDDRKKSFEETLPQFVFHSATSDKIPNEVNVGDFIKDPAAISRGMANLCGVAGLSMQKIQELSASTDTQMREGYEDHFRSKVSGGINEFWTQETYTVHFRFDREKMSVSISDGAYARRIPPLDRSDGFQWYLSF